SQSDEENSNTNNNSNNSEIINNVSVSTDTGGNTIKGDGEIIEGKSNSEIKVETVINGKVIDPINIKTDESEASVKSQINADGSAIQVQREIKVGPEIKAENYEVDLESSEETVIANPQVQTEESEEINPEEINNSLEQSENIEQSEKQEKIAEKTLTVLSSWFSGFADNFKSFFQNIFSIFK
ncbi:hypothetical protein KAT63_02130, partial [Candidatus Parcubacteria bacterium]|nr:hypothetical protein [Candidatus Parcubacteria bacterium]